MTFSDTAKIMGILKAAYPFFYKDICRDEAMQITTLWAEMFAEDDLKVVAIAVKDLIKTHSSFPPTIAHIKGKISLILSTVGGEPTHEDLWIILKKAICNGTYGAAEEFEKLPDQLKRYVHCPRQLKEMACISTDTLNTVTRGQFLKTIGEVVDREETIDRIKLPQEIYDLLLEGRGGGEVCQFEEN